MVPRDNARAMSQENVEIVRGFYEAFNRGDRDAWARLLASDVELFPLEVGGDRHGAEAVLRGTSEFTSHFASYEVTPERFYDAGDQIVVVLRRSARSDRSPALIEDRFGQLISLRNSLIVRFQSFRGVGEALEAAGLEE
jgi:ketosteroid isomerase-like protein